MEVKPGYKQTEVGVIPEEWGIVELSDTARVIDSLHQTPSFAEDGYPMVRVTDIKPGNLSFVGTLMVTEEVFSEFTKNYKPKRDDIVLSRVGSYGVSSFVETDEPFCMGQNTVVLQPKLPPRFLYYVLNSCNIRQQIEDGSYGSGYKSLSLKNIKELRIPVPPTEAEQRAIATALSDVDGLLGGLDRLIAKKRDLKQATMQQLLTGQTRIPGVHGEWEETTLGEVATFLSGGTPSRSNDDYWTGDIPWISASSLRCFEIWRSDSKVTKEAVAAGSKMAPVGSSLLLVRGSALHNEILCGLVTKPVCFNQDVKALVPRPQVVPRFLTLLIKGIAEEFLKLVSSAGNTAGVLDTKLLKAFAINLPSIHEQTAIAEVLTEMDAELAALEQRREKTRALKQAMMQELLTGRTRLL